ncbi:MAG: hypothetical protein N2490_00775 [Ignavibacteria bacterium]|nr:hypothetical protein [Ignavibacteria bacterium]
MNKKIFLIIVILYSFNSLTFGQSWISNFNNEKLALKTLITPPSSKVDLGVGAGFSFFNNKTGFAVGMFSEIKLESFSIVPQANYWKIDNTSNFEMAGLVRYNIQTSSLKPYVDGGIGINFYDDKDKKESFTKLGVDVGGGLNFEGIFDKNIIFVDGKYKIIISDTGNKYGYTLTFGIKFPL